jgi:hypothetical protein
VKFWLGVHRPAWLGTLGVPLMVSRRTLSTIRGDLPRAVSPWVLDSGGFTELRLYGRWTSTAEQYAADVRRYAAEIGQLEWCAPQDWMCEPFMLAGGNGCVGTGFTVAAHIERTVANFVELRDLLGPLVIPVVQGWRVDEYERCVEMFDAAGVDLRAEPVVGIGSVCRRGVTEQANAEIVVRRMARMIGEHRLHGFGVSIDGLTRYGDALGSSDSLAWSYNRRKACRASGADSHAAECTRPRNRLGDVYSATNCPGCAVAWRRSIVDDGRSTLFWRAS